ncbi:MAG: diaminopimelate epimerase [Tissierellia bacterium]|nr:diaminopimelate epimerase [Tissierellia bacterium]
MEFTKMEAAGNDFVLFNGFKYNIENLGALAKKACDRHYSVGGDGIMVCENSNIADIKMIYYNSDGTEGEMCGNGIRCFSKYVYENNFINKTEFTVETLAGIKTIVLELDGNNKVKTIMVNMGKANLKPSTIPVIFNRERVLEEKLEIDGEEVIFSSVLVGVPHVVIFVDNIENININELGKKIENHPIFPQKTNVNFIKIAKRNKIHIYTWERGAGRTLACGTGASASVFVGNLLGKLDNKVKVMAEGGELEIQIKENHQIFMKGGANTICKGIFLNM